MEGALGYKLLVTVNTVKHCLLFTLYILLSLRVLGLRLLLLLEHLQFYQNENCLFGVNISNNM